jgi:hypothetical protein
VKALDLGRFDGAPGIHERQHVLRRRNTMSDESKKVEPTEQGAKPTELSEQDLDKVAGGTITLGPGCILRPPPPPIKGL